MNELKALKTSPCLESPLAPYNSDPSSGTSGETESNPSGQSLFLAWSKTREIGDGSMEDGSGAREEYVPSSYAFPASEEKRDRGLWLFRHAHINREDWFRLHGDAVAASLSRQSSNKAFYSVTKRIADVAVSLLLLLLLLPFFVLVAVLVRLDSPGPAFFRQRRSGKSGEEFLLWKFRSMHTDSPRYAHSPISDQDKRLTRIGRLIRRFSIDELPQLMNVVRGEMSLVGPRPEMPFVVDRYTFVERRRLMVKPGITGLWQISPARSFPIHENLQYDLHYIHHQNLLLDVAILLRTVGTVIRGMWTI